MEAEKLPNMLTASWRPRKVDGIIQSKSKDLRTREADSENPILSVGEDEMSQVNL